MWSMSPRAQNYRESVSPQLQDSRMDSQILIGKSLNSYQLMFIVICETQHKNLSIYPWDTQDLRRHFMNHTRHRNGRPLLRKYRAQGIRKCWWNASMVKINWLKFCKNNSIFFSDLQKFGWLDFWTDSQIFSGYEYVCLQKFHA